MNGLFFGKKGCDCRATTATPAKKLLPQILITVDGGKNYHILNCMKENTVENYMTKSPVIIHETSSLKTARDMLSTEAFKHLPVLSDDNNISGMLSSSDIESLSLWIENAMENPEAVISNLLVKDIMTMKVVSITKGKTVEEANDIILSKGIRALPVVEDNKIIGIISETDILHYFNEKYSESK